MEDFERQGFVSESAKSFLTLIKDRFGKLYYEVLVVNEYCQQLQYKLNIQKENSDQIVAAVLYARTLSTYQALILASKRGMAQQVKMLLRCMFESLFPLVAIAENKGYSIDLITAEEVERLKSVNKLIRYKERIGEKDKVYNDSKKFAAEIKKIIEEKGIKKIGIADAAEKAGLIDWYDTAYSILSNTIHASMRSLEEHLHIGSDGNLEALKNEPELECFDQLYTTAIESMLYAVKAIEKIFNREEDIFVESTSKRIRQYYGVKNG